MQNKIERLEYYSSSTENSYVWVRHPNQDDIIEKINEILEYINSKEATYNQE